MQREGQSGKTIEMQQETNCKPLQLAEYFLLTQTAWKKVLKCPANRKGERNMNNIMYKWAENMQYMQIREKTKTLLQRLIGY